MTPRPITFDKHSGRAAFATALDEMGVALSPPSFEAAFARMRNAVDQSGEVSRERLQTIVDEVISDSEMLQDVAATFR